MQHNYKTAIVSSTYFEILVASLKVFFVVYSTKLHLLSLMNLLNVIVLVPGKLTVIP